MAFLPQQRKDKKKMTKLIVNFDNVAVEVYDNFSFTKHFGIKSQFDKLYCGKFDRPIEDSDKNNFEYIHFTNLSFTKNRIVFNGLNNALVKLPKDLVFITLSIVEPGNKHVLVFLFLFLTILFSSRPRDGQLEHQITRC